MRTRRAWASVGVGGERTMARFILLVIAAVLLAMLAVGSSHATVPGANGLIAFNGDDGWVYVVREDNSGMTRIGEGASPAWSPDGRRLALFRRTAGPCAPCSFALDVVDIATGRRATVFEGTTFNPAPAWSPNGKEIAFMHRDGIWLVRSDGSNARQLGTKGGSDPAWSPDGARLVYTGSAEEAAHLFVVDADGSGVRELTSGRRVRDLRPSWSPDGRQIAFVSDRSGSFELWVVDADGSGLRALTSGGPADTCWTEIGPCRSPSTNPSWSPDGTQIVFSSDHDGRLYVIPAKGGSPRCIGYDFYGSDPDWQPAVDLRVRTLPGPRSVRVGRTAAVIFRVTNRAPRNATVVRAQIGLDRRLALVSVPSARTIRGGTRVDVKLVVRARQPGRASVRFTIRAAEVDATTDDSLAVVRLNVAPPAS
jgi:dipeptidyl aminopeptidase/acylaminoacyl peptidase